MSKQYLSEKTWEMIEQRQTLRVDGKMGEVKEMTKQIAKAAKQDRLQDMVNTQEDLTDQKEKWTGIKQLKTKSLPNHTKHTNLQGGRVEMGHKADGT